MNPCKNCRFAEFKNADASCRHPEVLNNQARNEVITIDRKGMQEGEFDWPTSFRPFYISDCKIRNKQ